MSWLWPEDARTRVERVLLALAAAFFVVALYQIGRRMLFPWDLYIWSESPFMTNMWKLSRGSSVFDAPEDANSWVYAPGLEYLCFALLRPIGLALDVRACRFVVVSLGLLASWCAMRSSTRVYAAVAAREAPLGYRAFGFLALSLLVFRNFTSDVCHPDNAYAAHAMATLLLALRAFERPTLLRGATLVSVSALGILFKQTAAAGIVGTVLLLLVAGRSRWSLPHRGLLVAIGTIVAGLCWAALRSHPNSRYFLFDVLSHHVVFPHRLVELLRIGTSHPHVWVSYGLAAAALVSLVATDDVTRMGNSYPLPSPAVFVIWLSLGAEVLAAIASYIKLMGAWNNLGIVLLWLAVLFVPIVWHFIEIGAAQKASPTTATAGGALLVWLICLVPLKIPPTTGQYAFGHALDEHLRADLAAGRRSLLPHGTMTLLRAGAREVPFDRGNTVLEMVMADQGALAGTKTRIEAHAYDRIYMLGADFYGGETNAAITKLFHEVEVLPGDKTPLYDDYLAGYQNFMRPPVRVMDWGAP